MSESGVAELSTGQSSNVTITGDCTASSVAIIMGSQPSAPISVTAGSNSTSIILGSQNDDSRSSGGLEVQDDDANGDDGAAASSGGNPPESAIRLTLSSGGGVLEDPDDDGDGEGGGAASSGDNPRRFSMRRTSSTAIDPGHLLNMRSAMEEMKAELRSVSSSEFDESRSVLSLTDKAKRMVTLINNLRYPKDQAEWDGLDQSNLIVLTMTEAEGDGQSNSSAGDTSSPLKVIIQLGVWRSLFTPNTDKKKVMVKMWPAVIVPTGVYPTGDARDAPAIPISTMSMNHFYQMLRAHRILHVDGMGKWGGEAQLRKTTLIEFLALHRKASLKETEGEEEEDQSAATLTTTTTTTTTIRGGGRRSLTSSGGGGNSSTGGGGGGVCGGGQASSSNKKKTGRPPKNGRDKQTRDFLTGVGLALADILDVDETTDYGQSELLSAMEIISTQYEHGCFGKNMMRAARRVRQSNDEDGGGGISEEEAMKNLYLELLHYCIFFQCEYPVDFNFEGKPVKSMEELLGSMLKQKGVKFKDYFEPKSAKIKELLKERGSRQQRKREEFLKEQQRQKEAENEKLAAEAARRKQQLEKKKQELKKRQEALEQEEREAEEKAERARANRKRRAEEERRSRARIAPMSALLARGFGNPDPDYNSQEANGDGHEERRHEEDDGNGGVGDSDDGSSSSGEEGNGSDSGYEEEKASEQQVRSNKKSRRS